MRDVGVEAQETGCSLPCPDCVPLTFFLAPSGVLLEYIPQELISDLGESLTAYFTFSLYRVQLVVLNPS